MEKWKAKSRFPLSHSHDDDHEICSVMGYGFWGQGQFRLLCDFIKPYPHILLGLGGIQWACLLTLLYYSRDIARWLRPGSTVVRAEQ